ncbi:hypothetical protein KI387_022800, partial [Taxus chinensis]
MTSSCAKVILLEDPASKGRKLEEMRRNEDIAKACKKVAAVRVEVDKLSEQVSAVETTVSGRTKVADQDFVVIKEMLMVQLLKLDGIEAEGEAKLKLASYRHKMHSEAEHVVSSGNITMQNVGYEHSQ